MSGLNSRIRELRQSPDFRLEWDNEIGFHVARHLFELRRFRGLTQEQVAERMSSTQPKVAAAESGASNMTFRTFRKFIDALDGRLRIAVEPKEMERPTLPTWWSVANVWIGPGVKGWTSVEGKCFHLESGAIQVYGWKSETEVRPETLVNEEERSKYTVLAADVDFLEWHHDLEWSEAIQYSETVQG